jgi:hypothetical protein
MAENEPTLPLRLPTQYGPRRTWRQRIRAAFTEPVKLPGWAAIIVVVVQVVPDWKSRIDFWLSVAKSAGGYLAVAAAVVASPYFTPSLLAGGLAWVLFAGEAPRGVQRHHWLRYVGWSVFLVCVTLIVITAGYGALTFYVKEQVSQRDIDLQKKYASGPIFWHLTDAEKLAFKNELSKVPEKERFQVQIICLPDAGSRAFVEDIAQVFNDAGWPKVGANCLFNKLKPDVLGLYVAATPTFIEKLTAIKNMDDWPHDIRTLVKVLTDAKIPAQWANYDDDTKQDHFFLLVGNAPH